MEGIHISAPNLNVESGRGGHVNQGRDVGVEVTLFYATGPDLMVTRDSRQREGCVELELRHALLQYGLAREEPSREADARDRVSHAVILNSDVLVILARSHGSWNVEPDLMIDHVSNFLGQVHEAEGSARHDARCRTGGSWS
jgi:hypothetical protein